MSSKFYLYGSSPDSLAQQQLAEEGRFTNVAEGNRAADVNAQQFNIHAWVQAQQADEAARQRDMQNRFQAVSYGNEQSRIATADAENQRRFDLGQSLAAAERAKAETFQNRFAIPEAEAKLKRITFENQMMPAMVEQQRQSSLLDAFKVPQRAEDVDVDAISKRTGIPVADIKPLVQRKDAEFATQQAAVLNQQLNARLVAATRTRAGEVPIADTPELRERVRKAVEAEEPGGLHKSVKFNPSTGFYQVGGDAVPAGVPATFDIPNTVGTGTNPLASFGSTFASPVTATPYAFAQPGGGKTKVQLANEISMANPALTKEQVIAEVNRQFSQ